MTIIEWFIAILFISAVSSLALVITVFIVLALIGIFAKGYGWKREKFNEERMKK